MPGSWLLGDGSADDGRQDGDAAARAVLQGLRADDEKQTDPLLEASGAVSPGGSFVAR